MLPSLVIKMEYCRALHRGSKESSRAGSLPSFPSACTPSRADKALISRLPATKKPSVSSFAAAFLSGTAQYIENDVTHSKQTTATFLPGARTAYCHTRNSIANALSNRELELLEPRLTHRKQTARPCPNRELSTNPCFRDSRFLAPQNLLLHRRPIQIFLRPTI